MEVCHQASPPVSDGRVIMKKDPEAGDNNHLPDGSMKPVETANSPTEPNGPLPNRAEGVANKAMEISPTPVITIAPTNTPSMPIARPKRKQSLAHLQPQLSLHDIDGQSDVEAGLSAEQQHHECATCCSRNVHPMPDDPTFMDEVRDFFLCPPAGNMERLLVLICLFSLLYGTGWAIMGEKALPGGYLFGLFVIVVAAIVGGETAKLFHLPPLLGMLLAGFILKNIPQTTQLTYVDPQLATILRSVAFAVILTRAGLGLDLVDLKKKSMICMRLAFIPCVTEATAVAVASRLLLGFPWTWGFLLGFIMSAVSPAVIIPLMINLQENRFGTEKRIPLLVIAAATIDDVLAIGGFGIILGITFSSGDMLKTLLHGPTEVVIGIGYGISVGVVMWFLPGLNSKYLAVKRFLFVAFASLFAVFAAIEMNYAGAGALGTLTLSAVASTKWRAQSTTKEKNPVAVAFALIWKMMQPILFGLIGTEVVIANLDANTVGWGLTTICFGLVARVAVTCLVVTGGGLNLRERLFIGIAWLPKATIQAALGPVALDNVRLSGGGPDLEKLGIQVLSLAVLSIILTAPIGAIAISMLGPKLLSKQQSPMKQAQVSMATLHTMAPSTPEVSTNSNNDAIDLAAHLH